MDSGKDDISEEMILLKGKQSGFIRDGPQAKSKAKPEAQQHDCKICENSFGTEAGLTC